MLYTLAHRLVSWIAKVFFHLRVEGLQNIPLAGPLIIASNHASHLDIPLLGCSLPRPVHFVGKSELFKIPILGFLFRKLGGIPIRREGIDRQAMGEIQKRLQEGRVLVVYPEGRRTPDGGLQPAKAGIGMITGKTGVPVVPAYIVGTYQVMPKGAWRFRCAPVEVRFGPPLTFSSTGVKDPDGKKNYQKIADEIMNEISRLAQEKEKKIRLDQKHILPKGSQNLYPR